MSDRVGFTIGADASELSNTMRGVARDVERLERISSRGKLFDSEVIEDYDRGLQQVERRIQRLQREYRRAADEAHRFQEELDDIQKMGGSVSSRERERMSALKAQQRMAGHGLAGAQMDLEGARGRRGDVEKALERGQSEQRGRRYKVAGLAIAGSMTAMAMGQIRAGLQALIDDQLGRMGTERATGSSRGFSALERRGYAMGMTPREAHQIALQTSRATGRGGTGGAISNINMMRGYSMDAGSLTGFQQAARMGGDTATAQVLNRSILRAIKLGGIPRVLGEELTQTATSFMGQVTGARENVSASGMTGLIAMMGRRLGGVYRRAPGRTSQLLGGLHGTLTGGGGGEAGQSFLLRAAGFGRGKSYVQALEQLEKGVTDPQNIANMLKQTHLERQKMGIEAKMLHLHRLSGGSIKLHQARRLLTMRNPSDLAHVERAMTGLWTSDRGGAAQGEADKTKSRTHFRVQSLRRRSAQVDLALKTQKLVTVFQDLQIAALKLAARFAGWSLSWFRPPPRPASRGTPGAGAGSNAPPRPKPRRRGRNL